MYDGGKIITGLVIVLVLLLFPFWWNTDSKTTPPDPKLTAKAQEAKACIFDKQYMRESHMQVLDEWRNTVVRDAKRYVVVDRQPQDVDIEMVVLAEVRRQLEDSIVEMPPFGKVRDWLVKEGAQLPVGHHQKEFEMSLQNTCMDCHSNKKEFCDACHNYANVTPFCWDCHVEPEEKKE